MANESELIVRNGKVVSYVGPDATNLFRAITLRSALAMYAELKLLPARNIRAKDLLRMASAYSGKKYARGGHAQAAKDVQVWVETMRAALPIREYK